MSDFTCPDCDYIAWSADGLNLHRQQYCSNNPLKQTYMCGPCGRICRSERGLKQHMESYCPKRIMGNGNSEAVNIGEDNGKMSAQSNNLAVYMDIGETTMPRKARFSWLNILLCHKCKKSFEKKDFRKFKSDMHHIPVYMCNECYMANKKLEEVVFPNN